MSTPAEEPVLQSRVLKTENIRWKELYFIQQPEFKEWFDAGDKKLVDSLLKYQFVDPFKVWASEGKIYCLDGFHRYQDLAALERMGVDVPDQLPATFIKCDDIKEAAEMVLVYSSIYARITKQGLFDFLVKYELKYEEVAMSVNLPEFDDIEFKALFSSSADAGAIVPQSLQERFIIPPFSIFDTRQGYWQHRKKLWNQVFNSQETREDIELIAKSGQAPAVYELRNKMRESLGREPEWNEILDYAEKKGLHIYSGASVFDPVLTEVCYRWFCPAGGAILDPFAGGSVRGIVAAVSGFDYTGIDLRKEQVEANRSQWERYSSNYPGRSINWIYGDSNEVIKDHHQQYDFVFSCPPYHDLEHYSDDPADLSNMNYQEFTSVYQSIIRQSLERLKENRFACFVVGEIRDEKGVYRNFIQDTIDGFTRFPGCYYYNEIILVNVAGSLPVRVGRQFEGSRKVGKMHQNVLVFFKGDPDKIREEFPSINMEKDLQQLNYQPNIALSVVDD